MIALYLMPRQVYAVSTSLIFHLMVFFALAIGAKSRATTARLKPLTVEMVWGQGGQATGQAATATPPTPRGHVHKQKIHEVHQRSAMPPSNSTTAASTELVAPNADTGVASQPAQTSGSVAASPSTGASDASGSAGGIVKGSMSLTGMHGLDTSGLIRGYIGSLQNYLGRHHQYPASARRSRLEGTVQVEITIVGSGQITNVRVVRSSGHEILDEAAVQHLRTLGSVPPPPSLLQWKSRTITYPVVYRVG